MSNDITITAVGWAATTPREIQDGRTPYTSFRLASTPRWFDRARGAWAEGRTEWFTVKVFRDTALNVAGSIQKGQPVVVHGRLRTEEWLGENGPRTGLVIEASALGHDLTRGRATFAKVTRVGGGAPGEGAGEGSGDAVAGDGPAGDALDGALDQEVDEEIDQDVDEELEEVLAAAGDPFAAGLEGEESAATP